MKAPSFQYLRARTTADACAWLTEHGGDARILAGGQSLMPVLNMRLASPSALIDINAISELGGIVIDNDVLRIGALTRHREVSESALVSKHLPLIADAMHYVAHAAIRNRGTLGGSLCTADPAAEMPACCLALGARMVIESTRGRRAVAADVFFQGLFETAVASDELLVAVEFPVPAASWKHAFLEFSRRRGDFAIVGAAIQARVEGSRIAEARVVMFGVADRPVRMLRAEQALTSAADFDAGITAAQETLKTDLVPFSDNQASTEARLHLAGVVLKRALKQLQPAAN